MSFTDRTGSSTSFDDQDVATGNSFDNKTGTAPTITSLPYNNSYPYNSATQYNGEGLGDQYLTDLEHGDASNFTDRSS